MKSLPECEECKSDAKFVLQENRSKMTFLNPSRHQVLIVKVDNCVIKGNGVLRCDYAIVPCDGVEIYVELKGNDVGHAVKQLESTIKLISDNPQKVRKHCFIVSTRVPKQTTSVQRLQSQFKKKFNASLRVKNIQDNYDLSNDVV